jgi:hypothetical protein
VPARGAAERLAPNVIEDLPRNLLQLDPNELRVARRLRDERMSLLFRSWPSLSKVELRELRRLSDERQRLARHVGALRHLHALRAPRSLEP